MTRFIDIDLIKIPAARQRQTFGIENHQELVESIQARGLLHAPVMRNEGDGFVLVAGERRIRAMKDIWELGGQFSYDGEVVPFGMVPHVLLGEISPIEAEEAELEENLRRADLTWQEKVQALARLSALRKAVAEENNLPPPTALEILRSVKENPTEAECNNLGNNVNLARALADPDIAKAKSLAEAEKLLRRKEIARQREAIGASVLLNPKLPAVVVNADAVKWMGGQAAETFDGILTDPPYGIDAQAFGDSNGAITGSHTYDDSFESWLPLMRGFAEQSWRITKPNAYLYAFCDITRFEILKDLLTQAGWKVFRTPLIWAKPKGARAPWPQSGPIRSYEATLYAIKGDRKVNMLLSDVLTFSNDNDYDHSARKPVALFAELLRRSSLPGETVLDPFCGSGTIIPAALSLGLTPTAIELDPAQYLATLSRLEAR